MRQNVVRALADVVTTKPGIILFLSFHLIFSQKGFAYNYAFLSNKKIRFSQKQTFWGVPEQNRVRALCESKDPLW